MELSARASTFNGNTDSIDDTKQNALGTIAIDKDNNEYIYLQGVSGVAAGYAVSYDEAYLASLIAIDGSNKGAVAVAMAAVVANKFGWFLRGGTGNIYADTDVADNALVYSADTAGQVNDDSGSEVQIKGAVFRAARTGAGLVAVELRNPSIGIA
jgi:hypothetical protein